MKFKMLRHQVMESCQRWVVRAICPSSHHKFVVALFVIGTMATCCIFVKSTKKTNSSVSCELVLMHPVVAQAYASQGYPRQPGYFGWGMDPDGIGEISGEPFGKVFAVLVVRNRGNNIVHLPSFHKWWTIILCKEGNASMEFPLLNEDPRTNGSEAAVLTWALPLCPRSDTAIGVGIGTNLNHITKNDYIWVECRHPTLHVKSNPVFPLRSLNELLSDSLQYLADPMEK